MSERAVLFGASGGIGAALALALAQRGHDVLAGSRAGAGLAHDRITPFRFDLTDEASIAAVAHSMKDEPPSLVIVATGILTLPNGTGPERSFKALDPTALETAFRVNAIGPALIAKHMMPLFPRDRRGVFAALSARVGSIADNRIGGWHSYRASKAALNMLIKNFAIEIARTHPQTVVAALHPGTVDTPLSQPFQGNLPDGQLTEAEAAARNLLTVIDSLTPEDSGGLFAWDGAAIPY